MGPAIGEAAADINAARQEILANVDRVYDIGERSGRGHQPPLQQGGGGRRYFGRISRTGAAQSRPTS